MASGGVPEDCVPKLCIPDGIQGAWLVLHVPRRSLSAPNVHETAQTSIKSTARHLYDPSGIRYVFVYVCMSHVQIYESYGSAVSAPVKAEHG